MTQEILKIDNNHKLTIEKLAGQWWLEFIERKTGLVQILYCDTKEIAKKAYKKGEDLMTFEEIKDFCDNKLKLKKEKVYKEGK